MSFLLPWRTHTHSSLSLSLSSPPSPSCLIYLDNNYSCIRRHSVRFADNLTISHSSLVLQIQIQKKMIMYKKKKNEIESIVILNQTQHVRFVPYIHAYSTLHTQPMSAWHRLLEIPWFLRWKRYENKTKQNKLSRATVTTKIGWLTEGF